MDFKYWAAAIAAGVISSFLTVAIGRGFGFTRASRKARRAALAEERTVWLTGGAEARQHITEGYAFSILGALFAANAAWVLPDIVSNAVYAGDLAGRAGAPVFMGAYLFSVFANSAAAIFFLFGFGTILRYSKLRLLVPETNAESTSDRASGLDDVTAHVFTSGDVALVAEGAFCSKYCEIIHGVCQAIAGPTRYPGDDIRVTLFKTNHDEGSLSIVGRYPLYVGTEMPAIGYKIGEGTSGVCAATQTARQVESLPDYDEDRAGYEEMLEPFHIGPEAILRFTRKSGCYYALPVFGLDHGQGVRFVSHVVSIDARQGEIAPDGGSFKSVSDIVTAFIGSSKTLLAPDVYAS